MQTKLREALAVLQGGDKWVKDVSHIGDKHCAVGALEAVGAIADTADTLVCRSLDLIALSEVMREQFPERARSTTGKANAIAMINDHPRTTFADIERCFEKAALRREEEV